VIFELCSGRHVFSGGRSQFGVPWQIENSTTVPANEMVVGFRGLFDSPAAVIRSDISDHQMVHKLFYVLVHGRQRNTGDAGSHVFEDFFGGGIIP
jgi:hypothetical protein